MGANLNRVRLRKERERGDLELRDRREQDDALRHRFYDSRHKAQERSQSPHGDPEVYRAALASLDEMLQEAMRRKSNE